MPVRMLRNGLFLFSLTALPLQAADFTFDADTESPGGLFSVWGQGVIPSNVLHNGDDCDSGGTDICDDALGGGAYIGHGTQLNDSFNFYGDLTLDYHEGMDTDGDEDQSAFYAGLGLHFYSNEADPWGVFALAVGGSNLSSDNEAGIGLGGGIEKRFGNHFVQAGGFANVSDPDDVDSFEDFYFAGVGGDYALGNGNLAASLFLGTGDADEDSDEVTAYWAQIALTYTAPLGDSGVNWLAGVQHDWYEADDGTPEQAWFNTVKLGIEVPLGGKPVFKTPNLRAPVTLPGEFN